MVVNKKALTCFVRQIILGIESGRDQVSPLILTLPLSPINILINPDLKPLKHATIRQPIPIRLLSHLGRVTEEVEEEFAEGDF